MPWSTALRSRCVSGSLMASMMVLSSSVSLPSISTRTCLPQASARSRTTRGNLFQTLPIGCMPGLHDPFLQLGGDQIEPLRRPQEGASSRVPACWRIWFRARTNSPTRFISLSSKPMSTRMFPFEDLAGCGL